MENAKGPSAHAGPREYAFTALDLKSVGEEGLFEGYASLFDREDLGRDLIRRGAFAGTLARRGAGGVKMLFQHDPAEPIGRWSELTEDERGLRCVGQLLPDVRRAREILSLMRAGALDGLSIGFRVVKAHRDRSSGLRIIEQLDLWEISVVTFPMQPMARVAQVAASPFAAGQPTERQFERWLTRDAGLTRTEARVLISEGFRALSRRLEARGGADDSEELCRTIDTARRLLETSYGTRKGKKT
ncbi:MAG: HK97 family phage prohead protease [Rhizobiales bacterium]|nr:HK97 family phage prohead protease [Hyphomicrobiales bacterium]